MRQFNRVDVKSKKFIRAIDVKTYHDDSPDSSYIGEYSRNPGPADRTIDRADRGDMRHNEYRYFVAAMSGDDTGNPRSVEEDYKSFEALNAGDWHYIGVRAYAEIIINGIIQTITSGGLCGIESNSDAEYLKYVAKEQLHELTKQLIALGFTRKAIAKAFKAGA